MPRHSYIRRAAANDTRAPAPVPAPTSGGLDQEFWQSYLNMTSTGAVSVTSKTVIGLPAIGAAVSKVANAVAAMMTAARVSGRDGMPLVAARPSRLYGTYEWWQMVTTTLLMRGNFVGLIATRGPYGYAEQLVPIHPDAVTVDTSTGVPVYRVTVGDTDLTLSWDDVVHVRANTPVGSLWGQGVVERYRTALEGQLYGQRYESNSFKTGAVPSAIIQLDAKRVTSAEAAAVQSDWLDAHGSGVRKPAVIGSAMSVQPLSWSPEDAEFVESKRITIAEAALMCGLRPEDLSASIGGSGLTYANRQDDALQRIVDSFQPWVELIEQAWSDILPPGVMIEGSAEALLRTSTRERLELRQMRQTLGIETPEESRAAEAERML